jgi:hypothetical protein
MPSFLRRAWDTFRDHFRPRLQPRSRRTLGRLHQLEDRFVPSFGPVSPEFLVNTTTAGTQQTSPTSSREVAVAPTGNFVAVWQSNGQDGSGWGIYGQRFDAASNPQGPEFRVNTYTINDQINPVVAMAPDGSFVVAWQSNGQDLSGWGIYARRFDAAGNPQGSEFRVNSTFLGNQQNCTMGMDGSGNFVIAWTSNQLLGNFNVYCQQFDATGLRLGGETRVNTTTVGNQTNPSVAVAANGDFMVTWQSDSNQDGSGWGIFGQCFNAAANRLGGEFLVNTTTNKDQLDPSATALGGGGYVVTWSSHEQDGSGWGVYGQRFNTSGMATGPEFRINTWTANDQEASSVAADGAGNFVVVWMSHDQDGNGWGVFGQRYNINGVPQGGEFRVNATTAGDQIYPSVEVGGGNWVVLWSGNGQGDNQGVFARQFGAAGITVTPTAGLVTTQVGGTATFNVVLDTQPTSDVTIALSSSDPTQGTVSTPSLTFTPADWNTPQTVTVTGVDDGFAHADVSYTIITAPAVSQDSAYRGLDPADVSVTNVDMHQAGITVSPTSGLTTTEAGGQATFTVQLNTQPTGDVTIPVSSSNTAEGTVNVSSLTFTPGNWNTPQTVTVTGVDDFVDDGNIVYTIQLGPAASGDGSYRGLVPPSVSVTNFNNDTAGFTVSPTSGLTTTEAGGAATFSVVLTSKPTGDVTIPVSSSNTAEGTVNVSSLTFTPGNWNTPQMVTVTGVDDFVVDGNVAYSVQLGPASSGDATYAGLVPPAVGVTNLDNDTAGIKVLPGSGQLVVEPGSVGTFSVALTSQPTANVTIAVSVAGPAAADLSQTSLTFTPANWNVGQSVTVTATPGTSQDTTFVVSLAPAVSGDANYLGKTGPDVVVVQRPSLPTLTAVPAASAAVVTTVSSVREAPPLPVSNRPADAAPGAATVGGAAPATFDRAAPSVAARDVVPGQPPAMAETTAADSSSAVGLNQARTWILAAGSLGAPSFAGASPAAPDSGLDFLADGAGVPGGAGAMQLPLRGMVGADTRLGWQEVWPWQTPAGREDLAAAPELWGETGNVALVGVLASAGYLLLNTRAGLWILSLLTARPLWKEIDPLEIAYAWEREQGKDSDPKGETLLSWVHKEGQ